MAGQVDDTAPAAQQERLAKKRFQPLNLHRYGGLSPSDAFGRPGEASPPRQ